MASMIGDSVSGRIGPAGGYSINRALLLFGGPRLPLATTSGC
jgi:hypothetical protein